MPGYAVAKNANKSPPPHNNRAVGGSSLLLSVIFVYFLESVRIVGHNAVRADLNEKLHILFVVDGPEMYCVIIS